MTDRGVKNLTDNPVPARSISTVGIQAYGSRAGNGQVDLSLLMRIVVVMAAVACAGAPPTPSASRRLPPAMIQSIVRTRYDVFRGCYEQGLARNASLKGKVLARFVIGRDGTLSSVADGGSDLPDPAVVDCVLQGFYGLTFPAPDSGTVTVVYPVMLEPG
jgi:hypothetical protein